jgi:flagellar L-ring protein precursor FlgH
MNRRLGILVILLGAALLAGCNSAPKRDPDYAPMRPVVPPPTPVGNGAIYQSGYANAWFENIRARRVGDMLTIKLVEKTNANKKASTTVEKDNSTSVTNPTIFGTTPEFDAPGILPLPLVTKKNLNLSTSLESSHDFEGEGDSSQSNELTGDITVTVYEVLPNGYLLVRGEKRLGINQGNEYIKLSGIVRPADIDSSNTVLSTRLADPTIVYMGDGPVADSNVMGWLAKFFISALMPF